MNPAIKELRRYLSEAERIAFLTGAGMSTESGIPDFRSPSGIYASGVSQNVFDISVFRRDPECFYRNIRPLVEQTANAQPNAGHLAISRLGEQGKEVAVCTQNIDTLHQQAGSADVYPVHGTVETFTCLSCGGQVDGKKVWEAVLEGDIPPAHDACGGVLKPDIVFFGEMLPQEVLAGAEKNMARADVVVVAGTSLAVYPAAALPTVRPDHSRLVIINQAPTEQDAYADLVIHDSVGEVLAKAVDG